MTGYLSFFKVLVGLLPHALQAVQVIEAATPGGGLGTQKLELVKGLLTDAINAEPNAAVTVSQGESLIKAVVSRVVSFFNAVGIFKKSVPPASAA